MYVAARATKKVACCWWSFVVLERSSRTDRGCSPSAQHVPPVVLRLSATQGFVPARQINPGRLALGFVNHMGGEATSSKLMKNNRSDAIIFGVINVSSSRRFLCASLALTPNTGLSHADILRDGNGFFRLHARPRVDSPSVAAAHDAAARRLPGAIGSVAVKIGSTKTARPMRDASRRRNVRIHRAIRPSLRTALRIIRHIGSTGAIACRSHAGRDASHRRR
jgi:hypothetical protein